MSLAASTLFACTAAEVHEPAAKRAVDDAPLVEPVDESVRLPLDAGPRAPSHARFEGQVSDATRLGEPGQCAPCHGDVVASWTQSAHARSSFDNPWYRATVDALREDRGNEASRFCAGCHDPVLLADGAMTAPVEPDDPRAHAGITCLVCHSTQQTQADGNGSYSLSIEDPRIPDPASESQVAAHIERMTPDPLRTESLCGSCHRSFVGAEIGSPNHIGGIDDIGHWRGSAYAEAHAARIETTPVEAQDCRGCHMTPIAAVHADMAATDGHVFSHRVMASHTALAAQVADAEEPDTGMLVGAATIDVAAVQIGRELHLPAERAPRGGASEMSFDVVIRNTRVGHSFPGGTRDLQDTWVEVELLDAEGRVLAEAGTDHERGDDPSAFRLRSVVVDEEGVPEEQHLVHRFVTALFDRTLRPRDAMVLRYEVSADVSGAELPLRVRARLRHRKHGRAMRELACDASRSERGRAFAAESRRLGRAVLDGCAEEPVVEVASVERTLGRDELAGEPGADAEGADAEGAEAEGADAEGADAEGADAEGAEVLADWERARDLALGLSHQVQERLDEARVVGERALEMARVEAPEAVHELRLILARIAGRQGRLEDALALLDQNAEDVTRPERYATAEARVRGEAFAQVWQWEQAAAAFEDAARGAPEDALAWRDYARALGSAGQDDPALDAARRGLRFGPRNADLLRSQSLARRDDEAARAAFLAHRVPDDRQRLLRRCQDEIPGCDRDRQPVPRIRMHTP